MIRNIVAYRRLLLPCALCALAPSAACGPATPKFAPSSTPPVLIAPTAIPIQGTPIRIPAGPPIGIGPGLIPPAVGTQPPASPIQPACPTAPARPAGAAASNSQVSPTPTTTAPPSACVPVGTARPLGGTGIIPRK